MVCTINYVYKISYLFFYHKRYLLALFLWSHYVHANTVSFLSPNCTVKFFVLPVRFLDNTLASVLLRGKFVVVGHRFTNS